MVGLAIALAVLGLLSGAAALGVLAMKDQMNGFLGAMWAGVPAESRDLLLDQQARLREAGLPVPGAVIGGLALPIAIWLLVSASRASQRRAGTARALAQGAVALAVVEVGGLVVQLLAQARTRPIMAEIARSIAGSDPRMPAEVSGMMSTIMQASMVVGVVFAIGWSLGKIACCLWVRHVARKPEIRAWLGEGSPPAG
jgi:hypothetical protein